MFSTVEISATHYSCEIKLFLQLKGGLLFWGVFSFLADHGLHTKYMELPRSFQNRDKLLGYKPVKKKKSAVSLLTKKQACANNKRY